MGLARKVTSEAITALRDKLNAKYEAQLAGATTREAEDKALGMMSVSNRTALDAEDAAMADTGRADWLARQARTSMKDDSTLRGPIDMSPPVRKNTPTGFKKGGAVKSKPVKSKPRGVGCALRGHGKAGK